MFIKDGPKTPEEERLAHLPHVEFDPAAVAAAREAYEKQMMDEVDGINNNLPDLEHEQISEPSAQLEKPETKDSEKDIHKFVKAHVHPSKDKDELLDIHIGNPLKRITEILEDIKKQKAFSFTLKGSLGIMGVAVALSTFGIFGGSKALCDKGTQSYIGTVKQLAYIEEPTYPLLTQLTDAYSVLIGGRPHEKPTTKLILIQQDNTAINLVISRALDRGGPVPLWLSDTLTKATNIPLIITGTYDACSRTLTINQPEGVEEMR